VAGGEGEGVKDRLPPGRLTGLNPNGCNDIDQLRQAGDRNSITVSEQADEQVAHDDGIFGGVLVLGDPGSVPPRILLLLRYVGKVLDIPLIEG
jgi:hypothetical protein